MMHTLTLKEILKIYKAFNYPIYLDGDYNVNLFGIRNRDMKAGTMNDSIYAVYPVKASVIIRPFTGTTDPGTYWLANPMRRAGCFVLKANEHYPGMWEIAKFKGKYDAYCQKKPCKGYRDNNKNSIIDVTDLDIINGVYAICLHKTLQITENTKSSAGCQVVPIEFGWNQLINIGKSQIKHLGINSFSYSLFESRDIIQILGA